MRPLPAFTDLWSNYPRGDSAAAKAAVGGNLNLGWVTNTCVIRVCHALIESGWQINDAPGLNTARGANGKRYAFRVSEFDSYLRGEIGAPSTSVASPRLGHFAGQQGIILFLVSSWSDATGHFDLWNGSEPAGSEYFALAHEAHLWACSG
jgi:hypothetical protein